MARPHSALVDLAASRPIPKLRDVDALLRSAREHKMYGLLWQASKQDEVELPRDAQATLAMWSLSAQAHNRSLWVSLEEDVRMLESIGLAVATAKGVTAEERWYPSLGTRPTSDVDLLLAPSALSRADEALAMFQSTHPLNGSLGCLAENGDLQSVDILDQLGNPLDLHFDLLKMEVVTKQSDVIWGRTRRIGTPTGGEVRVLDPECSLIHFLVHINKDRFSRLLSFADIVRLVKQENLDWEFIDEFVRDEGIEAQVYLSLETVYEWLDLQPPSHPAPAGWRRVVWTRLWPSSMHLQGDLGLTRVHRRQFWLGVMSRGRTLEAVRRWLRRVFPPVVLLDYYFPGFGGPYLWHLMAGRFDSARKRRKVVRSLANFEAKA